MKEIVPKGASNYDMSLWLALRHWMETAFTLAGLQLQATVSISASATALIPQSLRPGPDVAFPSPAPPPWPYSSA